MCFYFISLIKLNLTTMVFASAIRSNDIKLHLNKPNTNVMRNMSIIFGKLRRPTTFHEETLALDTGSFKTFINNYCKCFGERKLKTFV